MRMVSSLAVWMEIACLTWNDWVRKRRVWVRQRTCYCCWRVSTQITLLWLIPSIDFLCDRRTQIVPPHKTIKNLIVLLWGRRYFACAIPHTQHTSSCDLCSLTPWLFPSNRSLVLAATRPCNSTAHPSWHDSLFETTCAWYGNQDYHCIITPIVTYSHVQLQNAVLYSYHSSPRFFCKGFLTVFWIRDAVILTPLLWGKGGSLPHSFHISSLLTLLELLQDGLPRTSILIMMIKTSFASPLPRLPLKPILQLALSRLYLSHQHSVRNHTWCDNNSVTDVDLEAILLTIYLSYSMQCRINRTTA